MNVTALLRLQRKGLNKMAVTSRKVVNKKNADGTKSGKAGTVYDVNLKYKDENGEYQMIPLDVAAL